MQDNPQQVSPTYMSAAITPTSLKLTHLPCKSSKNVDRQVNSLVGIENFAPKTDINVNLNVCQATVYMRAVSKSNTEQ